MNKEAKDQRGRIWEMFSDASYYDLTCVRLQDDRDFNSDVSFHFISLTKAEEFFELIKETR